MANEEFFLVEDREVAIVSDMHVRCDGGNGPLGHPAEFMTLERNGKAVCAYCGRTYLLDGTEAAATVRREAVA